MNKKIIRTLIILISIVCIIPFALEFLVFRNNAYSILGNGEWSGFLGSYIGGALGGIGTLFSVYFTTKETRKIQKENAVIIEKEKESSAKRERKKFADGIVQDVAKYVTNISKYFYDAHVVNELNNNIDEWNRELRDVKHRIQQNLELEKEMDFTSQKKEYIRIDREIEQLKQNEEELKYIIEENIRKTERNKADKTIAIECYFLIKMKLKDLEAGKSIMNQLEYIHVNSSNAGHTALEFIERETEKLLNLTVEFVDRYVSHKETACLE